MFLIWFGDIINIIFNSFKYRLQADEFIFGMNVKTRAKLGEKYIDIELYQKPWWVRFKVWCKKKKRDYQQWKHDRRQRLIEKEKAKMEQAAAQEADEAKTVAEPEKETKAEKVKKSIKDTNVFDMIDTYEVDGEAEVKETPKKKTAPKRAKVSVKTKNNKTNQKNTKNNKK